ncbi:hypothetical protein NHF40_04200 [Maricaulaceae bacterium EIL42A08]|nr:hypothetical protein [Maricaulaceae bacterium EIL42A08]
MMKPLMTAGVAALLATACVQAQSGPTSTFDGLAGSRNVNTDGNVEMNGAAISLEGRVGGYVEMNGAAVDVDAQIGGDLEANGGAVEIRGSVRGESLVNGGAVSMTGRYDGPVEVNGGAVDFDGSFGEGFSVNAGAFEFSGEAEGPVTVAGSGNNRNWMGRRRGDRSEIEINGTLSAGGQLCAHEVEFGRDAVVYEPLTVIADEEPRYADGFDASQITFVQREDSRCDEV